MIQHDWQPKASADPRKHIDIAPSQTRCFNHHARRTVHYARTTNPDSTNVGAIRGAHEFVYGFTDGDEDRGNRLVGACVAPQHSAQLRAVEHGRFEGGAADVYSNGGRCECLRLTLPVRRLGLGER